MAETGNFKLFSNGATIEPAHILFNANYPPKLMVGNKQDSTLADSHQKLLNYLLERIKSAQSTRSGRLQRFSNIDKAVSTWQKLSEGDSARLAKQHNTGQSQAIHMNLPVANAHIDDMTSYFTGIFSPEAASFFRLPKLASKTGAKALTDKMNADAKDGKYFKENTKAIRALLKYNIGGFSVDWLTNDSANQKAGYNCIDSIDSYNHMWDPAIKDPGRIAKHAEWSATVEVTNQRALLKGEQAGHYYGVGRVIKYNDDGSLAIPGGRGVNMASFYKYPPNHAGLTNGDDSTNSKTKVDWAGYGASLGADQQVQIPGWELIDMYCWINPFDFGLTDKDPNDYQLWRFKILGAVEIIMMEPVAESATEGDTVEALKDYYAEIPHYMGFLAVDDMGEATRSVAELLIMFGSFASFLLNAHIDATRSSIFGLTVYDPTGIDFSDVRPGETAARVKTKIPGRDVRSIIQTVNSNMNTGDTMQQLTQLLQLLDRFFPSQAMPAQVASIDRAVTSQVAAVMQGVSRRLHAMVRIVDDDVMGPSRFHGYINIARFGAAEMGDLTPDDALTVLGSGLQQINQEAAQAHIKEIIMALIQAPIAGQKFDLAALIDYWSGMLNLPDDMAQFAVQPAAQPGAPTQQQPAPTDPSQIVNAPSGAASQY